MHVVGFLMWRLNCDLDRYADIWLDYSPNEMCFCIQTSYTPEGICGMMVVTLLIRGHRYHTSPVFSSPGPCSVVRPSSSSVHNFKDLLL